MTPAAERTRIESRRDAERKAHILFFDFGPIFADFEADIGRTYVIGDDPPSTGSPTICHESGNRAGHISRRTRISLGRNACHWILEVHLVDRERGFGGFYEQLLDIPPA
jgi:hypothetical protein